MVVSVTFSRWPALSLKVMKNSHTSSECQSDGRTNKCRSSCLVAQSAPALLPRLSCTSEGRDPWLQTDDMPADLADSLKANEEDRKTDYAPLVQVKENEVVMLTATIETNLRQGDLGVEVDGMKGRSHRDGTPLSRRPDVVGRRATRRAEPRNSGADRCRGRSSPQSMRRFLWPCDSTDRCAHRRSCGWLPKAQATARVDVPTV